MTIPTLLDKLPWRRRLAGAGAQPLKAPEILRPLRYPYGSFHFESELSKQTRYEVQATANLKTWETVFSGTGNGPIEFMDQQAPKFSYRFYRLHAEGIFSRNAVGYVTLTLPPGFSLIANPLEAAESTVATVFKGMPDGTGLSKFNAEFYRLKENNVEHGKWGKPTEKLGPGEGAIFFNPTLDYKTVNFVGDLISKGFSIPIPAGFSVRSSPVPQPGQLDTDLGFPVNEGDEVHLFDRDRQAYVVHRYESGGWLPSAPVVGVGEAFWIAKTEPRNWVRNVLI